KIRTRGSRNGDRFYLYRRFRRWRHAAEEAGLRDREACAERDRCDEADAADESDELSPTVGVHSAMLAPKTTVWKSRTTHDEVVRRRRGVRRRLVLPRRRPAILNVVDVGRLRAR